ncbi:hypothetical protein B9Z19DRAFT_331642 [Tuber borchii]|uniref:Transmembrane protein n=1 Tax=Tuber borchii TaxID=42251 RepID=A0A2T6ZJB4_TUBBO|nr:hypothetical protein B9Z19DRAFT_331642 [Tuber borchii]
MNDPTVSYSANRRAVSQHGIHSGANVFPFCLFVSFVFYSSNVLPTLVQCALPLQCALTGIYFCGTSLGGVFVLWFWWSKHDGCSAAREGSLHSSARCTYHVVPVLEYGGIFGVNGITLQARVRPILPFSRLAFAFRPVDNHSRGRGHPLSNFLFTVLFSYLSQEL